MERLRDPRAQYKFRMVAPYRPADALLQENKALGRTRHGQHQGCQNQQIPSTLRGLRCQRDRSWQATVLLQAMQGRRNHGLVLQQGVPGRPLSSAQARMRRCMICAAAVAAPSPDLAEGVDLSNIRGFTRDWHKQVSTAERACRCSFVSRLRS